MNKPKDGPNDDDFDDELDDFEDDFEEEEEPLTGVVSSGVISAFIRKHKLATLSLEKQNGKYYAYPGPPNPKLGMKSRIIFGEGDTIQAAMNELATSVIAFQKLVKFCNKSG